jgi:FdrA protein
VSASNSSVTQYSVHPGVYKDSLVLMQLQHRLLARPGVLEAGAAMASPANLELLGAGGLLPDSLPSLQAEDLLVIVRAEDDARAGAALDSVEELLAARHTGGPQSFRPRSLDGALSQLPESRWVLVSVPGSYAARVTEDSLDRGLNVFLYSDNVSGADEDRLKSLAAQKGLMVLGPDCGTAIVAGTGLGFANHVRRGSIGLVGGSGTGLQAVSVAIHQLGEGVSQAIGTGGHDLSTEVGGTATRQGLRLLADDPTTRVIGMISKRPSQEVADQALSWAASCGKPVVVYLQGYKGTTGDDSVQLASSLTDAAARAVDLATGGDGKRASSDSSHQRGIEPATGLVRGLFAGGTLATETLLQLSTHVAPLFSNIGGDSWRTLDDIFTSREHTIIDLGADEFTRGRLHPMLDQEIRLARFDQEASDPRVGLILIDVVLGEGAHADPASELAPVIERALNSASDAQRDLRVVALIVGTEEDPQEIESQTQRLEDAGATVVTTVEQAVRLIEKQEPEMEATTPMLPRSSAAALPTTGAENHSALTSGPAVAASAFDPPLAAINIGLESFHTSLVSQGAASVQVDWRPPAGGNERLGSILDQLRANETAAAAEVPE